MKNTKAITELISKLPEKDIKKVIKELGTLLEQHQKLCHVPLVIKNYTPMIAKISYSLEWEDATEYYPHFNEMTLVKGSEQVLSKLMGMPISKSGAWNIIAELYQDDIPAAINALIKKENLKLKAFVKDVAAFEKKYKLEKDWVWENFIW